MSNKSQKTYTSINIRNSKFLLITGIAVAVILDALITALLIIGGYSFKFIAFPAVLLLLDVVYLIIGTVATNYRFRYSLAVWLVYVLLTCAACASGTVILLMLEGTVLTNIALILWTAVHAVSVICAIITALYTSKKLRSSVFTVIVTLLLALACAFYGVFLFAKGFFGQGYGLRTLIYDYNASTDSYTVSGVLSGKSEKVEIATTFNGKPVTAIDCGLFTENTVKEYVLHDSFELIDTDKLADANVEGKSILVDGDSATLFRAKLFDCAMSLQNRESVLKLANATLPGDLDEDKGYIAFEYDETAYAACGGKVIPLTIGNKGETLSLSSYSDTYAYLEHTDKANVADLKWSYENCNGYILDSISSDNDYVMGDSATVKVEFEKVYQIYVESGNDTKYDLRAKQTEFCCDELDDSFLDYRYVAKSNANTFFNSFLQREGFTLVWKYGEGSTASNTLTTLANAFDSIDGTSLTLCPEWTLNNPTVTVQANYSITYGDDVTFEATTASPVEGVSLVYEWKHRDTVVGSDKDLSLTHPSISHGYVGEYVLIVSTDGGDVTSLTSSAQATSNLAIAQKEISFGWEMPVDHVYSGTAKTITATFDNDQLVGSDSISYYLHVNLIETITPYAVCIDAGMYDFVVYISNTDDYKLNNTSKASYEITPLAVGVSWSNYDFTYNGLMQTPTATAKGVANDDYKELTVVSGGKINAGTYTATANCNDGNYTLTNNTLSYTIAKKALTVTANDCTAVYGNTLVNNGVDYDGFVNNETASVLGGTVSYIFTNNYKTVGTYTDCVIPSGYTSDNYAITFKAGDLTITQRPITVGWQNTTNLVYNGEAKSVSATVTNKVAGDDVTIVVANGNKTDAGDYVAEVTSLSGETAGNYAINEVFSQDYTIAKAAVTITPHSLSQTYGDASKDLTETLTGIIYKKDSVNNDFTYSLSRETGNSVGTYTISVILSGDYYTNYVVTLNEGTYTIDKRTVTITWDNYQNLTYDGNPKTITAALNNAVAYDDVYLNVTDNIKTDAGSYTATAELAGGAAGNYNLITGKSLTYSIGRLSVEVAWNGYAGLVYDSNPKNVTATITNTVGSDEVIAVILNGVQTNAGSYTAQVNSLSGAAAGNYKIEGTLKQDYAIAKASITLTADNASSVYGNAISNLTAQLTIGTIYNDEVSFSATTTATSTSPVGTYAVKVSVGTYNNYNITCVDDTYEITARPVTISWSGYTNLTYNGAAKNVTATVANKVGSDDVSVIVSNGNQINAGNYTATVTGLSGSASSNYEIADTFTQTYSIAKAQYTINPNNYTVTYGQTEANLVAVTTGTIYNNDFSYSLSREAGNTVGVYNISVNITGNTDNYDITTYARTYTITQREVTLTWSGYTNLVYNATAKSVTAVLGNTVAGDDVSVIISGGNEINAGSYTATASLSGTASANYKLPSNSTQAYTIAKAPVILTANEATSEYGSAISTLKVDVTSGTIYNNEVSYSATTSATSTSPVGNYDITVSVGTYSNYDITCVGSTYKITARPVTLTWSGYTDLVYDGTQKSVTATIDSKVGSDDVSVTVTGGNEINAGTYTATASLTGSAASNYSLSKEQSSREYTIEQLAATLSWNNVTGLVYNGTARTVTATVGNKVGSDVVNVTVSGGVNTNAGDYTATATALTGAAAGNYELTGTLTKDYTIAKAPITLTARNANSVYGGAIAQLYVDLTSGTIYRDDGVNYTVSTTATSTSPVGTYDIIISPGSNPNYDITTVKGTYTITQATPTLTGFLSDNTYTVSQPVIYGVTLADITERLPAQTLSGSWVWAAGDSKVVSLGENNYVVTFNPTDSTNYKSVSAVVTVTAKKVTAISADFSATEVTLSEGSATVNVTINGVSELDANKLTSSIKKDGVATDLKVVDGKITFTESGTYTIVIGYEGDDTHFAVNSTTYTITVKAADLVD
ncbi:MAG: beta strand repeat-containing protein [Candidatus Coproplasma sp.]